LTDRDFYFPKGGRKGSIWRGKPNARKGGAHNPPQFFFAIRGGSSAQGKAEDSGMKKNNHTQPTAEKRERSISVILGGKGTESSALQGSQEETQPNKRPSVPRPGEGRQLLGGRKKLYTRGWSVCVALTF